MWLYIPGDLYLRRQQNGRQLRVNLSCQKRRTLPPSARIHNRIFFTTGRQVRNKGEKIKERRKKRGGKNTEKETDNNLQVTLHYVRFSSLFPAPFRASHRQRLWSPTVRGARKFRRIFKPCLAVKENPMYTSDAKKRKSRLDMNKT